MLPYVDRLCPSWRTVNAIITFAPYPEITGKTRGLMKGVPCCLERNVAPCQFGVPEHSLKYLNFSVEIWTFFADSSITACIQYVGCNTAVTCERAAANSDLFLDATCMQVFLLTFYLLTNRRFQRFHFVCSYRKCYDETAKTLKSTNALY